MNVPALDDSKFSILFRKFKWMLLTLLAPETVALTAFEERIAARSLRAKIRSMPKAPPNVSHWTITHCFLVTMGGVSLRTPQGDRYTPRVEQFFSLLEDDLIEIPDIAKDDIEDKSKADWFIKGVALLQILWFVLEIIGRAIQHLAITTLELFTLATVSIAVFTYILWWDKPHDVTRPMVFNTQSSLSDLRSMGPDWMREDRVVPDKRLSMSDQFGAEFSQRQWLYAYMIFVCMLFGACHIIGWNFFFETRIERFLWRIASIACAVAPISVVVTWMFREVYISGYILMTIYFCEAAIYVVFRLYLCGEAFAGLRAVPSTVYDTVNWTNFMPHI